MENNDLLNGIAAVAYLTALVVLIIGLAYWSFKDTDKLDGGKR